VKIGLDIVVDIVTPITLRASLDVNSIGLRLAYVFLRKPNVSQSSSDDVLQKGIMEECANTYIIAYL